MKLTNIMLMINIEHTSKLITFNHETYTISKPVLSILKETCLQYGTTLEGSILAIKHHLNIKQKCPVLVSAKHQLMFFPIPLSLPHEKLWIRYVPSLQCKRIKDHQCVISYNDKNISLEVDSRMVNRQIKRCKAYIDKLNAYDLEYGLLVTSELNVALEELLKHSDQKRKGFS